MRPTPRRIVKTVFVVMVIIFIVTNLNLLLSSMDDRGGTELAMGVTVSRPNSSARSNGSYSNTSLPQPAGSHGNRLLQPPDKADDTGLPKNPSGPNSSYILNFIASINAEQKVR